MTCAETIKEITRKHLENGGVALGQCLTAVGWVGGTIPEMTQEEGLIELSTADVTGGGIAVGLALAGRRPIYIVRYQGFQWFNSPFIANYAAKSKAIWRVPCPVFIRSIAMDGAVGPVASGSHHGIFMRMPGVKICAPMTPSEYKLAWDYFISHDDPMYVSEHRKSFTSDLELPDRLQKKAAISLIAISSTRLNAIGAAARLAKENISCNIINLFGLKPLEISEEQLQAISSSLYGGLVLDGDFENGAAKSIAYDLMQITDKKIKVLALEERTAGFAPHLDNLPPTAEKIYLFVKKIIET